MGVDELSTEAMQLRQEVDDLRTRLAEVEETLNAIRRGEVDALVVGGPEGERVFTLTSADQPYRVFVEEMRQGVVTLTPAGFVLYCNRHFADLARTSLQTIIGTSIYDYVAPGDRPTLEGLLNQSAVTGIRRHEETEIGLETLDGHVVPVHVVLTPLHNGTQPAVGLVFTDLTQQKRNEEIVAEEKLARSILEQAVGPIAVCGPDGRIRRANQAARELCGMNPIGMHFGDAFPLRNAPAFDLSAILQGAVVREREARLVRPSGAVDLLVNAGPLRGAQSRILGCVIALWDITARKAAEHERAALLQRERAARTEAEAAVSLRDQFLSVASHELRTPLTVLLGNTQALLRRAHREPYLKARDAHALDTIVDQAKRLNRMISVLLDVTRLESGQMAINAEPIDLCALVRHVAEQAQPPLFRHTVECEDDGRAKRVVGDELRLEQVLHNLIQNAIRYSPAGGPIRVRVFQDERMAFVSVTDQGIGIPPEALPRLFTRFYRAPNAEAQHIDGMGIGLYVAKAIVERHGGAITVDSIVGKGSTFTLALPLATDSHGD